MNTDYSEKLLLEEEQALRIEGSMVGLRESFDVIEAGERVDEIATENEIGALEEVLEDSELLLGVISEQAAGKRTWQIGNACLTLVLIAASIVCYNLYVRSERQIVKLGQAEANVQTAGIALVQADGKVKTLEAELAVSKNELERVTGELTVSRKEVKGFMRQLAESDVRANGLERQLAESNVKAEGLGKELAETSGQLKDLQDRNEQVVKKMKERLEQL